MEGVLPGTGRDQKGHKVARRKISDDPENKIFTKAGC